VRLKPNGRYRAETRVAWRRCKSGAGALGAHGAPCQYSPTRPFGRLRELGPGNAQFKKAEKNLEKSTVADFSLIGEKMLKSRIYTIRGIKVMPDADLAEIYGYTTKQFNEQVKCNIARFDGDFRFQLKKITTIVQLEDIEGYRAMFEEL